MKLINKDILVAEIKKKIRTEQGYSSGDAECGYRDCAKEILSFLDTLEAKEVDIRSEVSNWWNSHYAGVKQGYTFEGYSGHYMDNFTIVNLAQYFYELGANSK